MGLEQVIGDVRRDGDQRAQKILDDAKAEAERILTAAKDKASKHGDARNAAAAKDAEQLKAQIISSAEFEARKTVLTTEAELRDELKQTILDGFSNLDAGARKKHITALLKTAQGIIAEGTVYGASDDKAALEAQDAYTYGGNIDILGGIIVESKTGKNRLNLSYETLLDDMWRDVLKQEAELFA